MVPLNKVKMFYYVNLKKKHFNKMMTNLFFMGYELGGGGGVKILYHNILTHP